MRLLLATPITLPKHLHKINVLVATAWSFCELVARTLINVDGKMKPQPRLVGTKNKTNNHPGKERSMKQRATVPITTIIEPARRTGFRRPVRVMITPVATDVIVPARLLIRRRDPATVADSRSTVWKYKGRLKNT